MVGDREIVQMDTGLDLLPGGMKGLGVVTRTMGGVRLWVRRREWDGDQFFGTWLAISCQKNDWT